MGELFDLTGQVAIITGSSKGIGRAIAERLAEHGAKVVISSRNQDPCDEVAAAINARHPGAAVAIAASISRKEQLQALVDGAVAAFGKVDILVCNAASNTHYGPMLEVTDEAFRKMLDNNLISSHWLAQMVVPGMRQRGGGAIVLVSSIVGLKADDAIGVYGVSKAADIQLARNLAVELGPNNIRVNCIAPGLVKTDFARALWDKPQDQVAEKFRTPLGRLGEPDDIAGAAVFLTSRAAGWLTGQVIVVDGGATV